MPNTLDLTARAELYVPADTSVGECWSLIIQGMQAGWLDDDELRDLLDHLRNHRDFGIEELLFAHVGDRLRVSFLDERATCSASALIDALSAISGAASPPALTS